MYLIDSDPKFLATLAGLNTQQLVDRRAQLERVREFIIRKCIEGKRTAVTDATMFAWKRVCSIDVALVELASAGNLGSLDAAPFTPAIELVKEGDLPMLSHEGADDELVLVGGVYMTRAQYRQESAPNSDIPSEFELAEMAASSAHR